MKEERLIKMNLMMHVHVLQHVQPALSFGDINNKESEVYKRKKDERVYHLLEYVGTKPNVFYHTKVRNIDKSI